MADMVGVIISAVVVIGSFVTLIMKIAKPINELNISIVELTAAIKGLLANDKIQDARIKKHGEEIDELKLKAENHETRIHSLERK